MCLKYSILIGITLAAYEIVQIHSRVELTNVKCVALDKNFTQFEYCRIKAVNRTYKYLSMRAKLLQVPVTNAVVNIAVMKRLNGYKPFLYNVTVDACKFMASNRKQILHNFFYSIVSQATNVNHTCPYDHDLILEQLTVEFLNHQFVVVLPVPEGDYAVYVTWYVDGIARADIRVYGTLS